MPALPGSRCIRAPTSGTSRSGTCTRSPTSSAPLKGRVEFNIEGDPRPGFLELVLAVKPDQCTLVPVKPGEITSEAGWPANTPADALAGHHRRVEGRTACASACSSIRNRRRFAGRRTMGADRVELYTEPFARAFERGPDAAAASFAQLRRCGDPCVRARRRRERGSRSRPEEPDAVQDAAAPRRGVDRARAHQPRDLRRPWPRREGIPGRALAGAPLDSVDVAGSGGRRHAGDRAVGRRRVDRRRAL